MKKRNEWNPAFARNKKIIELGRQSKWKDILQLYEKEQSDCFNNVNYATTMSQLGRIRTVNTRDPLFHSFLDDFACQLESRGHEWLGTRQLANTLHAISKMNLKNIPGARKFVTLSTNEQTSRFLARNGEPQEVANSAWAFAKYQLQSRTFFAELDNQADRLVSCGLPQEVANAAWACATLDVQAPRLFSVVEKNASWLASSERPQAIANTVWACAKLGVESPNLFAEVEKHAEWLVAESKTQELSNIVWACGTLEVQCPNLLSEINRCATWFVRSSKPQEIANTAWGYARLGVHSTCLFAEIDKRAEWFVAEGKPQEVANLAWACGTLEVQSPNLFFQIEKNARWLVTLGLPQGIANTAWACARLGIQSPSLFFEIENHAKQFVSEAKAQEITNTAWACATLGVQLPVLFSQLEARVEDIVRYSKAQGLANICYALAVLDLMVEYQKSLAYFWESLVSKCPQEIAKMELCQLVQVEVFASKVGISLKDPPPELRTRMDIVKHSTNPADLQSSYQKKVSSLLSSIGFSHDNEVSSLCETGSGGILPIDIACRERKVAIECDGPSHFLIASGSGRVTRVENGPTRAKRLFLERSGWTVINLRYQDWMIVRGNKLEEKLFLRERLLEGGVDYDASCLRGKEAGPFVGKQDTKDILKPCFTPNGKNQEAALSLESREHKLWKACPKADDTENIYTGDHCIEQRLDRDSQNTKEQAQRIPIDY